MIRKPARDRSFDESAFGPDFQAEYSEPPREHAPVPVRPGDAPANRSSGTTQATQPGRGPSVIDSSSVFDGKFEAGGDLVVYGQISGEVVCRGQLTIEQEASARARVDTRDAYVQGRLEGDIVCSGRLIIASTATITGTVKAAALVVEEGATIRGSVETAAVAASDAPASIGRPPRKPSAEPEPAVAAASAPPAASARWSRSREVPNFALVSSENRAPGDR